MSTTKREESNKVRVEGFFVRREGLPSIRYRCAVLVGSGRVWYSLEADTYLRQLLVYLDEYL